MVFVARKRLTHMCAKWCTWCDRAAHLCQWLIGILLVIFAYLALDFWMYSVFPVRVVNRLESNTFAYRPWIGDVDFTGVPKRHFVAVVSNEIVVLDDAENVEENRFLAYCEDIFLRNRRYDGDIGFNLFISWLNGAWKRNDIGLGTIRKFSRAMNDGGSRAAYVKCISEPGMGYKHGDLSIVASKQLGDELRVSKDGAQPRHLLRESHLELLPHRLTLLSHSRGLFSHLSELRFHLFGLAGDLCKGEVRDNHIVNREANVNGGQANCYPLRFFVPRPLVIVAMLGCGITGLLCSVGRSRRRLFVGSAVYGLCMGGVPVSIGVGIH